MPTLLIVKLETVKLMKVNASIEEDLPSSKVLKYCSILIMYVLELHIDKNFPRSSALAVT
jgi:hypothetical protein